MHSLYLRVQQCKFFIMIDKWELLAILRTSTINFLFTCITLKSDAFLTLQELCKPKIPLQDIALRGRFAAITSVQAPGADTIIQTIVLLFLRSDGVILRYRNG